MKNLILLLLVINVNILIAGIPDGKDVLSEGKKLFRLEKASWIATDIIIEEQKIIRDSIGGYLSYENERNHIITIFYDRSNICRIIARFEFDSLPKNKPIKVDYNNLNKSELEERLITIRKDVIAQISKNEDSYFSFYQNTSFNPVLIVDDKNIKVFILTGPKTNENLLLGNDYLLVYNKKNKLKDKEKIHKSLIKIPFEPPAEAKGAEITMHSHIVTDLITSTDICSMLLYKDKIKWKEHYVISQKYVSIFNIEKEELTIQTIDEFKEKNKKK